MLNKTNANWPQKPLSEVVDLNPRFDKSAYRDNLEVSFVPMAAVEAGSGRMDVSETKHFGSVKKGYTPFKEGDVLFAKITPCMENGKMAIVPKLTNDIGFGSTEFHVLRPHEGIDARYVYYFVSSQSFRREAAHQMTGAVGQKRVPQSFLEEASIPVPLFEEQQSIVAEIEKQFSRLDEAVASLKRTKANLKRYRAAVLKAAVEGKLTEGWRKQHPNVEPADKLLERILAERRTKWNGKGKYAEPEAAEAIDLLTIPKGWTWARLEQLGVIFGGLTKNPKRASFTKKLPYLRVANVYANELRLDEIEHIGVQDSELEKLLLQKGDLLLVEGNGSKDQIGRLAIWDGSIDPCVHQNHLIKVRLVIASVNKWILFWFLSPSGRQFIETVSSSTSGLYTLSVSKVGDLPIIFPPLAEQEQIIAEVERRLSVIDELEATVEDNLIRADRLRQATLQKAFSGKLLLNGAHR